MIQIILNISLMSTWSRDGVCLNCNYGVSGTFQGLFCGEVWADPARALCSCSVFMKVKGQPCRLSP